MNKRILATALLALVGGLVSLLLVPTKDRFDVALIWAGILPLVVAQGTRAGREFIIARAHIIRVVALLVLAVGLIGVAGRSDLAPFARFALVMGAYGLALPHLTRRLETQTQTYFSVAITPGTIDPMKEVSSLARELPSLLAPLLRALRSPLILLGMFFLFGFALGTRDFAKPTTGQAQLLLPAILLLVTTFMVLLVRSAIYWIRFIVLGQAAFNSPPAAGTVWSWCWRLFLFSSIAGEAKNLRPALQEYLPMAAPWQVDGLLALIWLVVASLASQFALILVAIALGDPKKSMAVALFRARTAGRKFPLGVAITFAPIVAATWFLAQFLDRMKGWVGLEFIAAYGLLAVATMVVAVTYLTRAYMISAVRNPVSASANAAVPTSPA